VNAQRPALPLRQNLEVAASLSRFYDSEGVFLPWHFQVVGIVAGDLQEDSAVGSSFIGLPG
jgi:hypothetical protein